ncbi:Retrovirus-related Pol polyprotein from transposon TNT 1-94 [Ceratobasidium sp. AG-Ba]|nr:Retrovirus-related Pol polyprotein from transposon TNT 1-94 [Ceratobasidium sp. AG-Ba]
MPPVLSKPTRCDECIRRNQKCDGTSPCSKCFDKTRLCLYGGVPHHTLLGKTRARAPAGSTAQIADHSPKPPAEPSHHRSSTPSSLGDPHTDQDISSDTVHDDSSSAFDSRTEYALSDDGIAEGSSDTDCYIEKSPPSPSSSSSSKFYAPKAGRYPASESAGSTCLHHDPLRMRGGAADGDAGEDGDANDGHGNDHEQNQTQDELIRAISAQQAEMQKALDRLLNDRKRKERDDDETEQLAAARAKLEREFEAIEDEDLAAVEAKIPYKIRQVFAGGWKKHVPFTMLTNAYCQSDKAFEEAGDQIVMGPSGAIKTAPTSLKAPARAEDSLLLPEWLQACQRFLILVEKYQSAKEYLAWKAHIDIIMSDDRRDEMWATWMRYDIELRERATRRVINAGKFHEDVFNRIERKDLANERAGRTAAFAQSVQSVLDQAQQAGPSGAGQYSFRANAKPTRANSNKSQPGASHNRFKRTHAKFCFRCGNDNHNHKYCNASTRINGKPLVVEGVFPVWSIGGSRDVAPETVCQKNTEFLLRLRQNSGMPEQETEQESHLGASIRPRIRLFWHPAGIWQFLQLAAAKIIFEPTVAYI